MFSDVDVLDIIGEGEFEQVFRQDLIYRIVYIRTLDSLCRRINV